MGIFDFFWGGVGGDDAASKLIQNVPPAFNASREADRALLRGDLPGAFAGNLDALGLMLAPARDVAASTAVHGSSLFLFIGDEGARQVPKFVQSMASRLLGVEDKSELLPWDAAVAQTVNDGAIQHWVFKGKRLTDNFGATQVRPVEELLGKLDEKIKAGGKPLTVKEYNALLRETIDDFKKEHGELVGFSVTQDGMHSYVLGASRAEERPSPLTQVVVKAAMQVKGGKFDIPIVDTTDIYDHLRIREDKSITREQLLEWAKGKFGDTIPKMGDEGVKMALETYFNSEGQNTAIINKDGLIEIFMLPIKKDAVINRGAESATELVVGSTHGKDAKTETYGEISVGEQLTKFLKEDGGKVAGLGALLVAAGLLLPEAAAITAIGGGLAASGLFGASILQNLGGVQRV